MFRLVTLMILTKGWVWGSNPSFEAFLDTHCVNCHGSKKAKGDLRIDSLSRDFKNGIDHLWAEVVERINAGEMPPEEEPRPRERNLHLYNSTESKIKKAKPHGWLTSP